MQYESSFYLFTLLGYIKSRGTEKFSVQTRNEKKKLVIWVSRLGQILSNTSTILQFQFLKMKSTIKNETEYFLDTGGEIKY